MERQSEVLTGCEVEWSAGRIRLTGEIDLANASAILRRIRAVLSAGDMVVDCRAVTFLGVAGLRMFTQMGVAAMAVGAILWMRCSPAVTETLNLCHVREIAGVVLDRDNQDSPGGLQ